MAKGANTTDANNGYVALPNRLRELREQRGLSRFRLAVELDVTDRTIERWESGATAIPDERKVQVCRYFGVKITDLIDWGKDVVG